VDDEASIRRIGNPRLSMIGYDVVTAPMAKEADIFRKSEPKFVVVLDVMMPKLDGYGVAKIAISERAYYYASSIGMYL